MITNKFIDISRSAFLPVYTPAKKALKITNN